EQAPAAAYDLAGTPPGSDDTNEPENEEHPFDMRRVLAQRALDRRGPTGPGGGGLNPLGGPGRAFGRARAKVFWTTWVTPADPEVDALIGAHANEIGKAWGIREKVSDEAIRMRLRRAVMHADWLRAKLASGERLTAADYRFVKRMDRIEAGRREL